MQRPLDAPHWVRPFGRLGKALSILQATLWLILVASSGRAQSAPPMGPPSPKLPPAAIQRLLDKQNDGGTLSTQEQQSVDDWQEQREEELQKGFLKSAKASSALESANAAGGFACPEAQGTTAAITPTRAQFVRLLAQLNLDYGKQAGDGLRAVTQALARAKVDAAGTNLALPLTLTGNSPAAVVAAVWSCARQPGNATFASNLGSLLDGAVDPRAGAVLAYGLSLGPDYILPNANQGWYLFNRGQLAGAKASFERAAKSGPELGPLLLGQGLIAHCQGEHRRAIDFLTRALSVSSSPAGEQALMESQAGVSEPSNPDEGQTEPENKKGETRDPSPEAVPTPRRDDWTKGARKPQVVFAEPVVPGTNEEHFKVGMGKNAAIVEGYRRVAEGLIHRQEALDPNVGRDRPPSATATSVVFYLGDEAMAELARAQYTAYAARIRAVRAPFERDFEQQRERTSRRVKAILEAATARDAARFLETYCTNVRPYLNGEYGQFKAIWRGSWEAEQKVIREYGEIAGATISRIRQDDLRKYLDIERQLHLTTMAMDGPADVIGWGMIGGSIMNCDLAAETPGAEGKKPPDEAEKQPCPQFLQNGLGVNLGIASVSLDCEKIAFQAGEGVIGRFEQNYVKHEQTYYLGVGLEATAGVGPVSAGAGASAGVFVTCSGNTVRDVGIQGSSSASVPGFSLEAAGTAAIVSGPRGSFSASAGVGGLSTGLPPGAQ